MTLLVPIVMLGWIPLGLWIFKRFNGKIAVIVGFIIAWCFLPVHVFPIAGLPDYSKREALGYVMLLGVICFDRERLAQFRICWLDVPLLLFCSSGFFSSVSNELGVYDGISTIVYSLVKWFLPYFLGRLYFTRLHDLRDLVLGIFIGGLVYVPFCVFELIMSPRLHRIVYGFHVALFSQTKRWGGWRPIVFMEHGLMVAMWMTTASLAGIHLLRTGQIKWMNKLTKGVVRSEFLVAALVAVTVLCKSTGAVVLLFVGWLVLHFSLKFKTRWLLLLLMLIPALYVGLRTSGVWGGDSLTIYLSEKLSLPEDRVGSLLFRFENEDILMDKAFRRPWLGWGGWKRSFVYDDRGIPVSVPDGLWIVVFGKQGWLGLSSLFLVLTLPQYLFLKRFRPESWSSEPLAAVGLVCVALLGLYAIDGLLNDMFSPLVMMLAGALSSLCLNPNRLPSLESNLEMPRLL